MPSININVSPKLCPSLHFGPNMSLTPLVCTDPETFNNVSQGQKQPDPKWNARSWRKLVEPLLPLSWAARNYKSHAASRTVTSRRHLPQSPLLPGCWGARPPVVRERWGRSSLLRSSRFGPGVRPGTEGSARHTAPTAQPRCWTCGRFGSWSTRRECLAAVSCPLCACLCVQCVPVWKRHVPKTLTSRHSNKLARPDATHDFNPTLIVRWNPDRLFRLLFPSWRHVQTCFVLRGDSGVSCWWSSPILWASACSQQAS